VEPPATEPAKPAKKLPSGIDPEKFKVPKAVEGFIILPTTTADGKHKIGFTEEGAVRCTSCDLMRRTYDAALEEPANQGLRKKLDDLEVDARAAAGNPDAESKIREREKSLEAELATTVDNYLNTHLSEKQLNAVRAAKLDPPEVMRALKRGWRLRTSPGLPLSSPLTGVWMSI
jgi:hypothetical protein